MSPSPKVWTFLALESCWKLLSLCKCKNLILKYVAKEVKLAKQLGFTNREGHVCQLLLFAYKCVYDLKVQSISLHRNQTLLNIPAMVYPNGCSAY